MKPNATLTIPVVREKLRAKSVDLSENIARSVSRLSSYDLQACTEYREEVRKEISLMNDLLFFQQCRATLEQAIESGYARLIFHGSEEKPRKVRFTIKRGGWVSIYGLKL